MWVYELLRKLNCSATQLVLKEKLKKNGEYYKAGKLFSKQAGSPPTGLI